MSKMASHIFPTSLIIRFITMLMIIASTLAIAESNPSLKDSRSSPASSFYDVLKSNGLPIGLFPKGISDFSLDQTSGRFELHLVSASPCDAKFETRVRYEWNITGSVNYGKIANLSGVAAQELFLWLPVKSIQVDIPSSGLIYFDVGVVFKQFSISFFETPKDCDDVDDKEANDFVFFDERGRIVQNQPRRFMRKDSTDEGLRAVS